MKGHLKALILIIVTLAVLIPLVSDFPDGLEKVAETLGVKEHTPIWSGLMPDYALPKINDPYFSTFFAGAFGVLVVLGAGFILGMVIAKPNKQ